MDIVSELAGVSREAGLSALLKAIYREDRVEKVENDHCDPHVPGRLARLYMLGCVNLFHTGGGGADSKSRIYPLWCCMYIIQELLTLLSNNCCFAFLFVSTVCRVASLGSPVSRNKTQFGRFPYDVAVCN